jgi:hypothetical protein
MRRTLLLAVSLAGLLVGLAHAVSSSHSFTGTVKTKHGAHAGASHPVRVVLRRSATAHHFTATLTASGCTGSATCPHGSLAGTWAAKTSTPGGPDAGTDDVLKAAGSITPLGHVTATGTADGTGFIARGRQTLHLTLHGDGTTLTVSALSGDVPSFTPVFTRRH